MCTTAPAIVLTPTDAVAAAGSIPTRCSKRTPSAMPPVPAGVMLDANDDATRDRNAGANGTGSATEPTNDTAANTYVSAEPSRMSGIHCQSASWKAFHVSPMFASCGSRK